jgi:dTDP-4-dehydrorhamnose 3,5-epimerase-like enzyme
MEGVYLIPRRLITDERGWFLKVITGKEEGLPSFTGEVYLFSGHAGQVRGNHYHPKANEWFSIVDGTVEIAVQHPETGERVDYVLSATDPQTIFVKAGLSHAFRSPLSTGKSFTMVAYSDVLYDPADTIMHPILENEGESPE